MDFGAGQADDGAGVELPATQDVVILSTVEMIPMTIEQINSEIAQIQNATTTFESNQESNAINIGKTEEENESLAENASQEIK